MGYKDPNQSPMIISVCFHPSFRKITTHSIYLNVSIGNVGYVLGVIVLGRDRHNLLHAVATL